jgi:hypothetical protein
MRSVGTSVLVISALIAPAQAQSTGNELLDKCEVSLNNYHPVDQTTFQLTHTDAFQCFGYMSAVGAFAYLTLDGRHAIERTCLPTGTTSVQLIRVLVNYGHQHPETLHESAIIFAMNSLALAFPCNE